MPAFIYSPQIRVRIACDGSKKAASKNVNVLDISEDLVQGTMTLRTNGVHTFNFQLQNTMRKYDGLIQPMDRITVEMKRITWVRVFSGYLNNGPIFSAFPRVIQLSASCTLKRLQFWFWDPTTSAALQLLTAAKEGQPAVSAPATNPAGTNGVGGATAGAGTPTQGAPATPTTPGQPATASATDQDGGDASGQGATGSTAIHPQAANQKFDDSIKGIVLKLLSEVVGWPAEKIHIGAVPPKWITFAEDIGNKVLQDADESKEIGSLALQSASVGGAAVGGGSAVNGQIQPGNYGGTNINAEQAGNASILISRAKSTGHSDNVALAMLMAGMQESTLRNLSYGDRDSVGIFQMRSSWGSVQQRMDPNYCANWWLGQADQKAPKPRQDTMDPGVLAQTVEVSAFPSAYSKWRGAAQAMLDAFNRSATTAPGTAAQNAGAVGTIRGAGGAAAPAGAAPAAGAPSGNSGRRFASMAYSIIASRPPGSIRYQLGGDDPYTSPSPTKLDCSSFVDMAYYRTTGHGIQSGRTTAAVQQRWATQKIPYALAMQVKGALLFNGNPAHHVEVSMGNGTSAAARSAHNPPEKQVYVGPPGAKESAALVPGFSYADAATSPQAAQQLSAIVGYPVTATDPNEFGPGAPVDASGAAGGATGATGPDPFNALLNVYTWGFNVNTTGDYYAGPRAMMNDTPILPYISNLLSASMRSFCSSPNGDFMAWFPDYFGIFGSAGKMNVRTIELQDFTVEWNDQKIVTHQYVVGAPNGFLNQATGTVSGVSTDASGNALSGAGGNSMAWELMTGGIATMEYPEIFRTIFGKDATPEFLSGYLKRFGGRPDMVNMPALKQGLPEFFMALYLFMQRWANQFKAVVPMTFMPELWPGMLLCLPEYNFQSYITEVQHTFRFGPGGGFQTQAAICAPAKTDAKDTIFDLLPLGGKSYLNATGQQANAAPAGQTPAPVGGGAVGDAGE